jgi:asparagine synthetase B (glutamine-hydrolysing)
MAVGLEGRVPLLDNAFLHLAARTPERLTMSLRRGKVILYKLAERYGLRVSSLKRGFAVPIGAYFAGPWRDEAREWFRSVDSDLVDTTSASRLLERQIPPAGDLWMLASLLGWELRLKRTRSATTSKAATVPLDSRA